MMVKLVMLGLLAAVCGVILWALVVRPIVVLFTGGRPMRRR